MYALLSQEEAQKGASLVADYSRKGRSGGGERQIAGEGPGQHLVSDARKEVGGVGLSFLHGVHHWFPSLVDVVIGHVVGGPLEFSWGGHGRHY